MPINTDIITHLPKTELHHVLETSKRQAWYIVDKRGHLLTIAADNTRLFYELRRSLITNGVGAASALAYLVCNPVLCEPHNLLDELSQTYADDVFTSEKIVLTPVIVLSNRNAYGEYQYSNMCVVFVTTDLPDTFFDAFEVPDLRGAFLKLA